jgi:hypothetical protein
MNKLVFGPKRQEQTNKKQDDEKNNFNSNSNANDRRTRCTKFD